MANSVLENINLFPSPSTPDLGCFIKRKHDYQPEEEYHNAHVDLNPSIDFNPRYHQCYFRVVCGHAAFYQRCLVYLAHDANVPAPILQNFPPDFVLGGDYTPRPSDWQKFPTQGGESFYWFFGQYRNPASSAWHEDSLVEHTYDIYENGTLSTVRYDDTGGDLDKNDLIIEVAIVGRRSWQDILISQNQKLILKKLQKRVIPHLKTRIGKFEKKSKQLN